MHKGHKRWAMVLTGLLIAVVVAACGSSNKSSGSSGGSGGGTSSSSGGSSSGGAIAIATPAKTTDYGWNAQGYDAAKAAAAADGMKVNLVQDIGYNNTDTVLRQLALKHPTLLIAHASGYDTSAQRIAQQYKVQIGRAHV